MWYTSGTLRQNKGPETLIFQWFPGFLQLFKLNSSRWLTGQIIEYSIDSLYLIYNSAHHCLKYLKRYLGCFGCHEVHSADCTDCNGIIICSLITHDTY